MSAGDTQGIWSRECSTGDLRHAPRHRRQGTAAVCVELRARTLADGALDVAHDEAVLVVQELDAHLRDLCVLTYEFVRMLYTSADYCRRRQRPGTARKQPVRTPLHDDMPSMTSACITLPATLHC